MAKIFDIDFEDGTLGARLSGEVRAMLARRRGTQAQLAAVLGITQGGVSARHLEVVLDGWDVCVRDLGSTNGTVVTPPALPALRLKPFDLVAIEPGTRVTLAGEATVVFEADG